MQTHITPNNKLASFGTIGLLFLAGIAGMVFLLPATPAHAAGQVTLSTISSGVLTAATSGTVGSTLVITGSGFLNANPIAITTTVGSSTIQWLSGAACTATGFTSFANSGVSTLATPIDSLVFGACLTTTASGTFQVSTKVPAMIGGAQTIVVTDGTTSVTTPFSVNPKVTLTTTSANYGFPQQSITGSLAVTGFGNAETVTVSETAFTTTSFTCITTTTGSCTASVGPFVVADTTGGTKTITATGATSSLTATTTFTVNPWAAFYNSATGKSTFSFVGSAPTSLLIEAHGLTAGTIAGGSITLGGVTTAHQSVVVGSTGAFGGAGNQLVVAPTANVPFGSISAVIQGVTFNYATGNIQLTNGIWGGALVSSIAGSGSSTGVVTTDVSSYKPGAAGTSTILTSPGPIQNQIAFFGYGFVPSTGVGCGSLGGGVLTLTAPTGALFVSGLSFNAGVGGTAGGTGVAKPDCNGALFGTATLDNTPWSLAATPSTAATFTETITQAAGPANVLNPSFGITPWVDVTNGATKVDYTTATFTATVHGFGATDAITITVGGAAMVSGGTLASSGNGGGTTVAGQVPDISSGSKNVVATGSVTGQSATGIGAVTVQSRIDSVGAGALTIPTGGAGSTTILRTGTTYGAHGLAASTGYNVMWNAITGSTVVGTFTSTATGGIPVPGVQITIPGDTSGIHIIDIQTAAGSSAIYGQTKAGDYVPTEAPFSSTYASDFGDLLFSNTALLSASPSVASVGSPETLAGSGLSSGGSYVVALGSGAGTVSLIAPALASFTATSTGSVPASTAITLTDTATTTETGTLKYFSVQTSAHFGTSTFSDAYAQFVLAASASLNASTRAAGLPLTVTAHALNAGGAVYSIVFNYVQSPLNVNSFTGTIVGVIAPNSVGAGVASFNVPGSATTGTYVVQLVVSTQGTSGTVVGTAVLNTPLLVTVGTGGGNPLCQTTSCLTAGTSTTQIIGPNKFVVTGFTNTSNAPVTAIIYAVVHNGAGQTVAYSTSTLNNVPAGSSSTAYDVLFGLAPGTYSVTIFATSTSGTAISTSSSVSVTV